MRKLGVVLCLLGAGLGAVWSDTGVVSSQPGLSLDRNVAAAAAPAEALPSLIDPRALHAPGDDIYVDAVSGHDNDDGLTPATAYRTIQKAASVAGPGATVRVLPGIYRETVRPQTDGTQAARITYLAESGAGTAVVRGSEPSSSLAWTQLTANTIGLPASVNPTSLYVTDLSAWGLSGAPRFVVHLDGSGEVQSRLPLAREPDWYVATPWRYHELWWTADGGVDVSPCDPSDPVNDWNCDVANRCATRLTDRSAYAEPDPRIEAGDLTTLGNLTGAELMSLDAKWGHYLFRREIVGHEVGVGRITVEGDCLQDGGYSDPGLGWGSKYYVENHPALLDTPGEWWYDAATGLLYLWPLSPGNPSSQAVEISRRDHGVDLTDRSFTTLDGLTVELVNENAVDHANYWAERSHGNTLRNLTLRYANHGLYVQQSVRSDQSPDYVTRDFQLLDSEISHTDTHGLFMSPWWDGAPNPDTFPWSGVYDVVIRGNEFHHLGFEAGEDNAIGLEIQFPDRLTFADNHVHDVAHNGVQFLWSVIDSGKSYDFAPSEIKTGDILVVDNLFEDTCQLTTDCGALKFWGQPPNNHVFRDVLVAGNVFRDVAGWTYVATQRIGWWAGGEQCQVNGQAGFGLYLDYAAGIHAYRNLSYNNSYAGVMLAGTWRDGDLVFANNTVANSLYGFRLSGVEADTHGGSVDTRILSNIVVGSEGYGIYQCTTDQNFGSLQIDHNLYFNNGWRPYEQGGVYKPGHMAVRNPSGQTYYQTLADIQSHPYHWEAHGVAGDPAFQVYDPADHDPYDGSWPDFRLSSGSVLAIDGGSDLPATLISLLARFAVDDPYAGSARDIGWREGGILVSVDPVQRSMEPGESVTFTVSVEFAGGDATSVSLSADDPDPEVSVSLSPSVLTEDGDATLAVTATPQADAGFYEVLITATGSGFSQQLTVGVLIADAYVFLPLVFRN